uniref:Large ribosomal subunit protein uL5c n=1 Tax=Hildenbrandia rivularis TaxID=135206 RepID=A0A1C9CFU2_9FLOR|nr:ribosomal protein L5 [Hildenbrandia rivularis]AOM67232.1 ribosomal protein L5 [Hildenbrandia rivularis]
MTNKIKTLYNVQVKPKLRHYFKYQNIHEVPKLVKITLNRGLGEDAHNAKLLNNSLQELTLISGQKPIITRAKKSIAGFKLREQAAIGLTVNLRRDKMYSFLQKLIHLSLPNIRDFRGMSKKGFDGHGNYNLGIHEQLIFPEIMYDSTNKTQGLNITIVTTAKTDEEGIILLQELGMPFQNQY